MEFIKSPLKEALTAMLGVPLPVNLDGVFDVSEIEDDEARGNGR